jgi:hypothetical protein
VLGVPDGSFDADTRRAIDDYQRSRGHAGTGWLDRPTIGSIMNDTRSANQGNVSGADVLMNILRSFGQQ